MNERRFSMKDRLNMIPAKKMTEGKVYHIKGINKIIEFTGKDKKPAKAIVVNTLEGIYFLPNVIANDMWKDDKHSEIDESVLKDLMEYPVQCVSFTSKTYGTKGLTLVYAQDPEPEDDIADMLEDN